MKKPTKIEDKPKPKKTRELLRFHRMKTTLKQKEAAKLLKSSTNYVSSTETGARLGSAKYLANFGQTFKLSNDEKAELLDSVLVE